VTGPSILIACVGNIFLGDDAFGVEVARRLAGRAQPAGVRVVDYGIRGLDLAYAMIDGYDATILVDATARGGEPGTLYLIEADAEETGGPASVEAHAMSPEHVLGLVRSMGGVPGRVLVVGCEPETFGPEDEGLMGLSAPVEAALGEAVNMIESLVATIRNEPRPTAG
jgi:hydrogenase maturation protease